MTVMTTTTNGGQDREMLSLLPILISSSNRREQRLPSAWNTSLCIIFLQGYKYVSGKRQNKLLLPEPKGTLSDGN